MRINVHAGHNADGRTACGAIGIIRESTEARRVKDAVVSQLRQLGHTVHDCTVDDAAGVSDNLKRIMAKCNANEVDLDVSIHFNSAANDPKGDGKTTGVETWIYSASSAAKAYAENICKAVSDLGFRNRGVKVNSKLYVLKNTNSPAMLVECCFVDDRDDVQLYDCQHMADAIVYGITGQRVQEQKKPVSQEPVAPGEETPTGNKDDLYRVQVIHQYGAFSIKANAERLQAELKASGYDAVIVKA